MEIEGIVYSVLSPQEGVSSRGSAWKKQDVILETQDGEYTRKVCVTFFGDKTEETGKLAKGEKVRVSINIESREFNGKWYTNINGWRLERLSAQEAMPPMPQGGPEPYVYENAGDDLPF